MQRNIDRLQVTGFTDVAPVVREQTLKSVLTIITKLSDRTINGELLRYLAKTANDEQPGIRTNTTICLGKIAKYLGSSSRSKVLIAAFSRSLRDPFVHARNASLMALSVTSEYFTDEDCAVRLMPAICPSLIDKEKLIRDQASKTVDVYTTNIKPSAASMPDTLLPPESAASAAGGPRMSTPQPAESAAASWAGWAISSFTNKLSTAAGEIQPSSTPVNGSAAPPPTTKPPTTSSASTLHRQALKSPSLSTPLSTAGRDSFFPDDDDADANEEDAADAWGDMDDMVEDDNNTNNEGDDAAGFFTANDSKPAKPTTTKKPTTTTRSTPSTATATPFDDNSEPDFAGWLAAQAEKKKGGGGAGGKGLPKGLSKAGGSSGAKKTVPAARPKAAAVAAKKKIDLKPKQSEEEDGWGGW
jgi:SCY1-like protein 1